MGTTTNRGTRHAMSSTVADPRLANARAAPKRRMRLSWSDPAFRAIVWQVVIVGLVALIVWYLIRNTNRNLAARHIATGFGFLGRVAGIPIGESLIPYDPAVNTYGRALLIGILQHAEGVGGRHRACHHPRHADRHRPAVEATGCWRGSPRFYVETLRDIPAAAATAVLVHAAAGPAGAAPVAAHRQRGVPVQPRHEAAAPGLGSRPHLGRRWPSWPAPSAPGCGTATRGQRQEATGVRPAVWPVALGAAARPAAGWSGPCWARRSDSDLPGPARLQLPGRRHHQPGIFRPAARPGDLHRRLHRRDRPLRHPGRAAGPVGGRRRARPAPRRRSCARSCCRRRCA